MGSVLMRTITMFFGYVYPAYSCFKSIEKSKSDMEEQRFWCQYWVLIAVVTFLERIADVLMSWVPMYHEAKLAFIVYLWYPKTKGTNYVYTAFLKPLVSNYEPEIDRKLVEIRSQASSLAWLLCQRVSFFVQAKCFELLHSLASPQNRLKAYRQYFQQLDHGQHNSLPVSPHYCPQTAILEEESEEINCSVVNTAVGAKPPLESQTGQKPRDRYLGADSPSSLYTKSRHRMTYIRG